MNIGDKIELSSWQFPGDNFCSVQKVCNTVSNLASTARPQESFSILPLSIFLMGNNLLKTLSFPLIQNSCCPLLFYHHRIIFSQKSPCHRMWRWLDYSFIILTSLRNRERSVFFLYRLNVLNIEIIIHLSNIIESPTCASGIYG